MGIFLLLGIGIYVSLLIFYTFETLFFSGAIYVILIPISYLHYRNKNKIVSAISDEDDTEDEEDQYSEYDYFEFKDHLQNKVFSIEKKYEIDDFTYHMGKTENMFGNKIEVFMDSIVKFRIINFTQICQTQTICPAGNADCKIGLANILQHFLSKFFINFFYFEISFK